VAPAGAGNRLLKAGFEQEQKMERYEETLEKLVAGLKEAYGDDLESVILYGSAASKEYHHKHSDLNVLVVVRNSRFHKISRASRIARWWNKNGNPPPLFFTAHEMAEATDVFPIEFSDMKDCHRILFGKDTLSELVVDHKHQRMECEHELRGKLLNLRSRYVLVAGDVRESTHLLAQSISSFATLFRHALHLAGKNTPLKKADIFDQAAREFQFDASPFLEVLAVRRGEKELAKEEIDPLFEKYVDAIQRVTERVDGMAS
jgi:predicted nucleotidyltransferase